MRMKVAPCAGRLAALLAFSILHAIQGNAQSAPLAGKDSLPPDFKAPTQVSSQGLLQKDGAIRVRPLQFTPFISAQQLVKGNLAGVFVQEPSGEPGTEQNMFIRGISSPLLSKRELFDNQAAVFLNGIPLSMDNPFAYEIQQYDFNRIGPATNLLANLNINNVASIEVIKDPAKLALLGPIAANGAIWITTKAAKSGERSLSIHSYYGVAPKERVMAVNGVYENNFRLPFYDMYGTMADRFNYPAYLKDSSNADYYGRANWTDLYYKNQALYNLDMSLTGGSERANFRFFGGATKNANSADETSLQRYNASFSINVLPLKWLTMSSLINAAHMTRDRNRSFRDRLAEARYIPDVSNPLTPNKEVYGRYLSQFEDNVKDDNTTNTVQGYFNISAHLKGARYNGGISFDYNEAARDVFYPTQLLENNNFVSNYFGYNQRFIFSNSIGYNWKLDEAQSLDLEAGQSFLNTLNKFDYAYAYNGPNNFIKLNIVNGNRNADDYLTPQGFDVFYHPSTVKQAIASFYGKATYNWKDAVRLTGIVRRDGSSAMQPDNRWYTGYAANIGVNAHKLWMKNSTLFSSFDVNASFGSNGKLVSDDRFAGGPNYRSDLSWTGAPTIGSYAGLPGLSRPYNSGWVGFGIPWAKVQQASLGFNAGLLKGKMDVGVEFYSKTDKDMMLAVPVAMEYGYASAFRPGMDVNNSGVDLTIGAAVLQSRDKKGISMNLNANLNYNRNELKALPGGLNEVIIGNRLMKVGERIDAFWVYQNEGKYNTDAEVPVNPSNAQPIAFEGVTMKAGDARWKDVNGDFAINSDDKILAGNSLPKITGGFGGDIAYKAFTLDFQFYFALGHYLQNQYAAAKFDFINYDASSDINAVKEITFWERKMDLEGYPMYNPWSNTVPYRLDQDLFLDKASFLKLRSLTLSYNLISGMSGKGTSKTFKEATVYLTGANLFTITSFKGTDPELVQYNGIYNGYGLPIQRSFILGVKIDL